MSTISPATKRRAAALLSVSALALTGFAAVAAPANAAIVKSAGNTADGIPSSFRDSEGVALVPCAASAALCGAAFDPADATYFAADAETASIKIAYSMTAGAPAPPAEPVAEIGQESRFDATGLLPGRYTIKDPWGTINSCSADATGDMNCRVASNRITSFLHTATHPAGFLGNPGVSRRVTGSPTGFNRIVITGPAGFREATSAFALTGQLRAGTPMTSLSTKALNMGTAKRAVTKAIRVSSFGTAPARLAVTKAGANPGAFTVTGCANVASGAVCNLNVRYTPKPNKAVSALLRVRDGGLAVRTIKVTGQGVDTIAPKLASHTPARGASNVGVAKSVRMKFSEGVRGVKQGVSLVDSNGSKVRAKVARVGRTNRFVVNPRKALAGNTSYTVKVNGGRLGVSDLSGNAVRDSQWKFRTR